VSGAIKSIGTGGVGYGYWRGPGRNAGDQQVVTVNKATGQITVNGAALASNTVVSFTFTNSEGAAPVAPSRSAATRSNMKCPKELFLAVPVEGGD
jgi:hypothetical protein